MSGLEVIGSITVGSVALSVVLLLLTIGLNMICGALGAVRLKRVHKHPVRLRDWRWISKRAVSCWHGPRFNGDVGEYYQIGGLKVPPDIRDRIYRTNFHGA